MMDAQRTVVRMSNGNQAVKDLWVQDYDICGAFTISWILAKVIPGTAENKSSLVMELLDFVTVSIDASGPQPSTQ